MMIMTHSPALCAETMTTRMYFFFAMDVTLHITPTVWIWTLYPWGIGSATSAKRSVPSTLILFLKTNAVPTTHQIDVREAK
jgi:hypothetical protein